jgi:hypothetical protein
MWHSPLRPERTSTKAPKSFTLATRGFLINGLRGLDRASGLIAPRTPIGQATINTLNVSDALRLFARKLQIEAGLVS